MNDQRRTSRRVATLILAAVFGTLAAAQVGDLRVDGFAARDGDCSRAEPRMAMLIVSALRWLGDPGSNSPFTQVTSSNPFNSVHESTYAMIAGEKRLIAHGDSIENMTIRRPIMTIRRNGGMAQTAPS